MIKKITKEQLLIGTLVLVLGAVILIPLPEKEKEVEKEIPVTEGQENFIQTESTEEQLKRILQKISGVGNVDVLITYEDDGKRVIEKDESVSEELVQEADSSGGTRTTTTNRNDRETVYDPSDSPLIVQKLSPTIRGVLVVAEGAGNSSVKKQIQETIEALFGLDAHKISIMKMEVSK